MIGNDIVDLDLARQSSDIFRPRYFEKILNASELNFVENSKNQFLYFWRIWTLKEAAYKAFQRLLLFDDFFNPSLFSTKMINDEMASVSFQNQSLDFETETNSDFIYSWTSSVQHNVLGYSKFKVLAKLNQDLSSKSFDVNKDINGLPFAKIFQQKTPISISHHGRFYALVI